MSMIQPADFNKSIEKALPMIGLILLFLLLVVFAAIFGFGWIASTFTSFALILFWIFVVPLIISIIARLIRRIRMKHLDTVRARAFSIAAQTAKNRCANSLQ